VEKRHLPTLKSDRVELLLPDESAAPRVLDYFVRNVPHHGFTLPDRPKDFLTEGYWRKRLVDDRSDFESDTSMRMFMFHRGESAGPVIGDCGLTNFVRGPLQACFLGYGLDHDHVGRGLAFEGVGALVAYAFETLGFHRIMAGYLPTNERSGNLLRRLGFTVEGYARDYLYLNNAWRDHILTALINPNPKPPPAP